MIDGYRQIEAMSPEELREEVGHWRQTVACYLTDAIEATESQVSARLWKGRYAPAQRLREMAAVLRQGVTGEDMFPACEGCGKPVKPGELVVQFADVGEMHAVCAGATLEQCVDGGRIPVDADMLELEDGEEPPADPHLAVYRSSELYTPEQIAEKLAAAEALLVSPKGRKAA